jgi:chorismate--pyruvate lyase
MRERDWLNFIPGMAPAYATWMHDHGSLTRRIQQNCGQFQVRNFFTGLSMASIDETSVLQLPRRQHIYTRDVLLYADNKPVVYAHSVVAGQHLRGAWHTLQHLGSRSLGSLLFTHPLVRRSPLRFCTLTTVHPLYQQAIQTLDTPPSKLWARRSLFMLHGAPLLVTEIFLPDILLLNGGNRGT